MVNYSSMNPPELYDRRFQLILEFGRLEQELNKRRAQDRHIMRQEEQVWVSKPRMEGLNLKQAIRGCELVSPELGFNVHNYHAFMLELPPGSQEGTYHMHGEAIKHYLRGKGVEIIGDKKYEVKAGDTIFIPAFTWHGTQNTGTEPLKIVAISHGEVGAPLAKQIVYATRDSK